MLCLGFAFVKVMLQCLSRSPRSAWPQLQLQLSLPLSGLIAHLTHVLMSLEFQET
jgi:hypothetical protein